MDTASFPRSQSLMWFNTVLQFLPLIIGAIQHVQQTVNAPGATKKAKVLDIVNTALETTGVIAPEVLAHPAFQDALGKVNDAVVFAGQIGQAVATDTAHPAVPPSIVGK